MLKKILFIVTVSTTLCSCKDNTGLYVVNGDGSSLQVLVTKETLQFQEISDAKGVGEIKTFQIIENKYDKIIWINEDGQKDTLIFEKNGLKFSKFKFSNQQ
nr:hypothetical protein [uncultured Flavobacterium sp.]